MVVIDVIFCVLFQLEISDYIVIGEFMDKVGVYGIQGKGGCFVRFIIGSYYVVVGLLLVEIYELLSYFIVLCNVRGSYDS